MACQARKDGNCTIYTIPEDKTMRDAGGKTLVPSPELEAWWTRKLRGRRDETFLIRQENGNKADVLELTLGQLYDLHHAIGCAILGT